MSTGRAVLGAIIATRTLMAFHQLASTIAGGSLRYEKFALANVLAQRSSLLVNDDCSHSRLKSLINIHSKVNKLADLAECMKAQPIFCNETP
ncbi:hypothetical protein BD769DRAFT_1674024 [Suillus cothurnatus]|nr:hypothetical protein BD769DRAFT_1674024 [Suillus cothurnatus]